MGGGHAGHFTPGVFTPPRVRGVWFARLFSAGAWFFVFYRMKQDGPHHFFKHHDWSEPHNLAYLEEIDRKYGTSYATDNMHHH